MVQPPQKNKQKTSGLVRIMAVGMKRIGQIWERLGVELMELANNESVSKIFIIIVTQMIYLNLMPGLLCLISAVLYKQLQLSQCHIYHELVEYNGSFAVKIIS